MARFNEELFEDSLCIESNEWTKDTLSGLPTCKGVLLFVNASGQPIQLLQVASLRRTALAKLIASDELPSGSRKTDISELTAKIYYVSCHNNIQSQLTYIRLAHTIFEKDASDWIQLPKPSFSIIEMDDSLPYFYVSDILPINKKRKVFGFFPNRKTASLFCKILNTVFVLCRNPSLLNSGKEASCPYLQMETCPGPCLDMTLREKYSDAVRKACDTASGKIQSTIESLHEQMSQAAQSMQFEKAALVRKKIERLKKLTTHDFCWIRNLENLCILHIDLDRKRKIAGKNRKRQLYKAYQITTENIYELGTFVPKTPEQIMSFLNHTWNQGQEIVYTFKTKEHLATLSLSLFRSGRSGLWLDCTSVIPKDCLCEQLHEVFGINLHDKNAEKKDAEPGVHLPII